MDEKLKEILDQYSLEILSVSRGRGAFLCQTGQGLKIVQEYHLSPERLVFESMVKYIIRDRGYVNIDQIVVNKEGELCSKNKYDRVFTVRDWYDGRECDMKSRSDLLEAARIDGLSYFGTFNRVMLPISVSPLLVQFIFAFIAAYNDYNDPLYFLTSNARLRTIQLTLAFLVDPYEQDWPLRMAACIASAIPMFLLYLCTQKIMLKGLDISSSVKG